MIKFVVDMQQLWKIERTSMERINFLEWNFISQLS